MSVAEAQTTTKSRAKTARQRAAALAPAPAPQVSERDIAARAFELYCERGCDDGHDLDDWLQAERELTAQAQPAAPQPAQAVVPQSMES